MKEQLQQVDREPDRLLDDNPFYIASQAQMGANIFAKTGNRMANVIRRNPFILIGFVLAGLAAGVLYLNFAPRAYTASMIVGPAESEESGLMSLINSSPL